MTAGGSTPRRSAGYPGRDRLDASSQTFRRAVARLHREALHDQALAADLEPIITAACAALDRLSVRADEAAGRSERNQVRLRRQVSQLEAVLRQMPPDHPEHAALGEQIAQAKRSVQPGKRS